MIQSPNRLERRGDWRYGTSAVRREIEIRYSLGRQLRFVRRRAGLTQVRLAELIGCAPSTICKIERASRKVSIDVFLQAMIAMRADELEIALSFVVSGDAGIQRLRQRGNLPGMRASDMREPVLRRWVFGR